MARKCLELEKENTDASLEELEKATAGSLRKAVQDGNYEEGTFMSGQIAGMLKELHPCEEILKGHDRAGRGPSEERLQEI